MKRFCLDTSGLSTPLERMPDDIYQPLWERVIEVLASGTVAVTTEIYDEMHGSLWGVVGDFIDANRSLLVLEVAEDDWDWRAYRQQVLNLRRDYYDFISEYGGSPKNVGLNDVSIIAMAKTLQVPLVSMERASGKDATRKRKIPDVCLLEAVEHIDFNEFLRRTGISLRHT